VPGSKYGTYDYTDMHAAFNEISCTFLIPYKPGSNLSTMRSIGVGTGGAGGAIAPQYSWKGAASLHLQPSIVTIQTF